VYVLDIGNDAEAARKRPNAAVSDHASCAEYHIYSLATTPKP